MKSSERLDGPDILRSIAVIAVLFTHMLSYSVQFNSGLRTPKWFCYVASHYLAMICVPLFLMLTGFLCSRKKLSKSYYGGLVPVILSYVIIAVLALIFDRLAGGEVRTIWLSVLHIFDFKANEYAWYVEMYIGLFLLIPFLNLLADALTTKKQWHMLLITLVVMTGLPDMASSVIIANNKLDIFPDFWNVIYPLTYYFAGAYIARFRPQPKKWVLVVMAAAAVGLQTAVCAAFSVSEYAWWVSHGFGGLPIAVTAASVFLLFYDVKLRNTVLKTVFRETALCSYEMYLLSYISDKYLYDRLPLPAIAVFTIGFVSVYAV